MADSIRLFNVFIDCTVPVAVRAVGNPIQSLDLAKEQVVQYLSSRDSDLLNFLATKSKLEALQINSVRDLRHKNSIPFGFNPHKLTCEQIFDGNTAMLTSLTAMLTSLEDKVKAAKNALEAAQNELKAAKQLLNVP